MARIQSDKVGIDTVATIAIGRNYAGENRPLSASRWRNLKIQTRNLVADHAKIIATCRGIGADSTLEEKPEQTFVIIATNPVKMPIFRTHFSELLKKYNQSSAAVAMDRRHKPVFS